MQARNGPSLQGDGDTDCYTSDVGHWLAMTGLQELRWAAGHMGPALQKIFVGQGPRALSGGCDAGPVRVVRQADPYAPFTGEKP